MDSEKIIHDLNRKFAEPLPGYYKRRIIVWYDEDGEFKDRLEEIQLENAKVIAITGSNYFAVRKMISIDEQLSNILLYNPISYDRNDDNWLMDIELYSEEFRADLTAMWFDEMHLVSTGQMRVTVKKLHKFFNAKPRREKIARMKKAPSSAAKLNIAVMAIVSGLNPDSANPSDIIRKVLGEGFDPDTNLIFKEFINYRLDEAFWEMVSQGSGYYTAEGEDMSLEGLFTHILLMALSCNFMPDLPEKWVRNGTDHDRGFCYELLSDWVRGDDREDYQNLVKEVEGQLDARAYFMSQQIQDYMGIELFSCIDEVILTKLMTEVTDEIIHVEKIRSVIEQRRVSPNYLDYRNIYEGLFCLANMQEFYLEHSAGFHNAKPRDIWNAYLKDYYRMDQFYRLFHTEYEHYLLNYNESLDDLYHSVMEKVENLYSNWFLAELSENWTAVCREELELNGRLWDVPQQVDFYRNYVSKAENRIFVVISDAMRYEVAEELAQILSLRQQSKVKLSAQQGVFPTVTRFGMAALLPHKELQLTIHENGFKIQADGQSTESYNRENVLKSVQEDSCSLKYSDIIKQRAADRSTLVKGKKVVYIYHDTIDEASHHEDSGVFDACKKTVEQLQNLVDIMVKDFKALNIVITSDHGFLYTAHALEEYSKLETKDFKSHVLEIGRRYVLADKKQQIERMLPVKLLTENEEVVGYSPRENIRLKCQGGQKFVHGGASLQEMVVPVIEYQYVNANSKAYQNHKDVYDTKVVRISLLTANHLIGNRNFNLEFYQNEPVSERRRASTYYVYFIDSMGIKISDMQRIIANKTKENGQDRVYRVSFSLKAMDIKPNESYYLVIADENGIEATREEFNFAVVNASRDQRKSPENIYYFED